SPARVRQQVTVREPQCVFPWCTRRADRADLDHIVPWEEGGPTCGCNLAPLCRRHHRAKTHAGWSYVMVTPGTYLWHSPGGATSLVDSRGTFRVPDLGQVCGHGPRTTLRQPPPSWMLCPGPCPVSREGASACPGPGTARMRTVGSDVLVVPEHLGDDEGEEFLREHRVQPGLLGQRAQTCDLPLLTARVRSEERRVGRG